MQSVVSQVRKACKAKNRLAALLGAVIGGYIPVASWTLAHRELDTSVPAYAQVTTYLVLGGLLFSAKSVFNWCMSAFGDTAKAAGFVVLLEGVLLVSKTPWLSVAALGYLASINAVTTAVSLATRPPRP